MVVVAEAFSRMTGADVDEKSLVRVLVVCFIGLAVPLLAMQTYGLDLSPGFF
jgi:hypothetical protein